MPAVNPRSFSSVPLEDLAALVSIVRDWLEMQPNIAPGYRKKIEDMKNEMLDELYGR